MIFNKIVQMVLYFSLLMTGYRALGCSNGGGWALHAGGSGELWTRKMCHRAQSPRSLHQDYGISRLYRNCYSRYLTDTLFVQCPSKND